MLELPIELLEQLGQLRRLHRVQPPRVTGRMHRGWHPVPHAIANGDELLHGSAVQQPEPAVRQLPVALLVKVGRVDRPHGIVRRRDKDEDARLLEFVSRIAGTNGELQSGLPVELLQFVVELGIVVLRFVRRRHADALAREHEQLPDDVRAAGPEPSVQSRVPVELLEQLGQLGKLRRVPFVFGARNKVPCADKDINERMLGNASAEPRTDVLELPNILFQFAVG